jgi:hypothetical protein
MIFCAISYPIFLTDFNRFGKVAYFIIKLDLPVTALVN